MTAGVKVNLQLLTRLRKETFSPLAKARAALVSTNNDYSASLALLNAQPASSKLATRETRQGLVSLVRGQRTTLLLELLCETDFVSKSPDFQHLLQRMSLSSLIFSAVSASQILEAPSSALDSQDKDSVPGESVAQAITRASNKMGENIKIGRVLSLSSAIDPEGPMATVGGYVHSSGTSHVTNLAVAGVGGVKSLGSIASLVKLSMEPPADGALVMDHHGLGKAADKIAQHIVAMSPTSVSELLDQEMFLGPDGQTVAAFCQGLSKDFSCNVQIEDIVRMQIGQEQELLKEVDL